MNVIDAIEREQIRDILDRRDVPDFRPGDTVRVTVYVSDGASIFQEDRTSERKQAFEGVCIARSNRGINSSFTVRKVSYGEGVERVFPLYSPVIESIEVVRHGRVRRAKLYYLRNRSGKSARIPERRRPPRKIKKLSEER